MCLPLSYTFTMRVVLTLIFFKSSLSAFLVEKRFLYKSSKIRTGIALASSIDNKYCDTIGGGNGH